MKFDFVNTSKKTACHSLLMRGSRAVFFSLFISSFLILTACTDYVSKIDEQIEEMKAGLLIDSRDGQTYKIVTIGSQTWMAQNLNYEMANSFCYNDNPANCVKYGRLYTWAAAMNACPEGWHLPSISERVPLFTTVGGYSVAGSMLKSASGWLNNGNGADAYSFTALPAGGRNENGTYVGEGLQANFWSSTGADNNGAEYVFFESGTDNVGWGGKSGKNAFSVRCVKGNASSDETSSSSVISSSSSSKKSESSSSSTKVTDPAAVTEGTLTDSRDGQTYKTVVIGKQTWMAQNLNYETANSYCYNDYASNCTTDGRLYTWAAAMDSAGTWSTNGRGCGYAKTCSPTRSVRGVCPNGWHLPTMDEFETLFAAVGDPSTVGLKLKSTSGWNDYNGNSGNGTDDYSFSALPVGYRGSSEYGEGYNRVYFWSSTEHNSSYAYSMDLNYYSDLAYLGNDFKYNGFSVRCVKD